MNNLIEIKLQVTPVQLSAIAQLLTGETPAPVAAIPADETPAAPGPSTTAVDDQLTPDPSASVAADAFAGNAESTATPTTADQSASSVPGDTPPPPAGVELAKGINGQMIPWDARIHGAAKKTNADGTWRLKQGIDRDVLVPQVEAELLAAQQAGKPADASIPPAADTPAPASAATPPPPATTPPPPAAGKPTTFAELLPLVTAAKAAGTLTDEKIAEASTALGLGQFGLIATRPDLIPQMVELLGV